MKECLAQAECPFEQPVLSALAAQSLAGDLLQHALSCATCRDAVSVWSYLQTVTASEAAEPLPAADFIWWKAQLARKHHVAQRSLKAIQLFNLLALILAGMALSLACLWFAPRLSVPPIYLWGAVSLIGTSLFTAVSFVYSARRLSKH